MKKRVLGTALAAAFAIGAIGGPAVATSTQPPPKKVDVCHFGGHHGLKGVHEFLVDYVKDGRLLCASYGGNVINISYNGWHNGHYQPDHLITL